MLHIDPETCIDCAACTYVCPTDAIAFEDDLSPEMGRFKSVNADYFAQHPLRPTPPIAPLRKEPTQETLRVAVVGSGPAGCYSAKELLRQGNVRVDMFEKLPTPYGLIRYGVAPDHLETRGVATMFDSVLDDASLRLLLNVEVGRDISHEELLEHYHAVIYSVGASVDREFDIPGADLTGSVAGSEFVGWYNGHPDHTHRSFDLSSGTAVIIGNGNVALDIARVLTMSRDELLATDIPDHVVDALDSSSIRDVVVVGRRGPQYAAYTAPEFMALGNLPAVDPVVDERELQILTEMGSLKNGESAEGEVDSLKLTLAREYAGRSTDDPDRRRIHFRYGLALAELIGDDRVRAVRFNRTVENTEGADLSRGPAFETIEAGLLIRAIGFRGQPVPGLPFDAARGACPTIVAGCSTAMVVRCLGPMSPVGSNAEPVASSGRTNSAPKRP